jgi:hypothetical protein
LRNTGLNIRDDMGYKIRIAEGPFLPFSVDGFTSRRNAHRHLFKHVMRICEQSPDDARSADDPEAWSEIISDPPLKRSLEARRSRAIKELASVPQCSMAKKNDMDESICRECAAEDAIAAVDMKFQAVLASYESAGEDTFMWALENPSRHGPRWVVFLSERKTILIKAVDNRRVKVMGNLDPSHGFVRIISCYKTSKKYNLNQRLLRQGCEKAGYKRMGLLINVEAKKV